MAEQEKPLDFSPDDVRNVIKALNKMGTKKYKTHKDLPVEYKASEMLYALWEKAFGTRPY